jgi:hypothetical protein
MNLGCVTRYHELCNVVLFHELCDRAIGAME